MKKFYNKALMYQSFLLGKWFLILGLIFFALITTIVGHANIAGLTNNIRTLNSDRIDFDNSAIMIFMLLLLFVLYIVITGFNKKNNLTFIQSGPFTKKQIKNNEILFLSIALLAMICIYFYVYICLYFKYKIIISMSVNYFKMLALNIVRMLLVGMLFISYIELMDCLFTNTIILIFSTVMLPFVVLCDLEFILQLITRTLNAENNYLIKKLYELHDLLNDAFNFCFNFHGTLFELDSLGISRIIIILAIIFAAGICIYIFINFINKKFTINNMNKVFIFPLVGKLFFGVISFNISLVVIYLFFGFYLFPVEVYIDLDKGIKFLIISILFMFISTKYFGRFLYKKFNRIL